MARKQNSVAGGWGCGSRPFPVVLRGGIIKRGGLASRLLLHIVKRNGGRTGMVQSNAPLTHSGVCT